MTPSTPGRTMDDRWFPPLRAIVEEARDVAASTAPHAERVAELLLLTLRWRCLAEIVGQAIARTESRFRKAFGVLRDAVRTVGAPRLEALDPHACLDWVAALAQTREELDRIRAVARERDDRARAAAVLFDELRSIPARYVLPEDPEGVRLLRDGVAELVAFLPLRDDLARFALPYRAVLGSGFDFLWNEKTGKGADGKGEETRAVHLTRRRLLERLLGRMLSKHAIGAVHAPIELVLRGFPPHQYGLAKEALDAACQAGLVGKKGTSYGERVFLEPALVRAARDFCQGRNSELAALDRWVAGDARRDVA